jgi:hypothetical protein
MIITLWLLPLQLHGFEEVWVWTIKVLSSFENWLALLLVVGSTSFFDDSSTRVAFTNAPVLSLKSMTDGIWGNGATSKVPLTKV